MSSNEPRGISWHCSPYRERPEHGKCPGTVATFAHFQYPAECRCSCHRGRVETKLPADYPQTGARPARTPARST